MNRRRPRLSIVRQCELLALSRSGVYYRPAPESFLNLSLMRLIDEQFLETPYYGARQMARHLRRLGHAVGRKRVGRLMDNVFIERLWQSMKYECVYLHAFETGSELRVGLTKWIGHYNTQRPHSALAGRTPDEAYYENGPKGRGHLFREMTIFADKNRMTISLLLYPDDAPGKWDRDLEEPSERDTYDQFVIGGQA